MSEGAYGYMLVTNMVWLCRGLRGDLMSGELISPRMNQGDTGSNCPLRLVLHLQINVALTIY